MAVITDSTVSRAMSVGQEIGHAKAKDKTIIQKGYLNNDYLIIFTPLDYSIEKFTFRRGSELSSHSFISLPSLPQYKSSATVKNTKAYFKVCLKRREKQNTKPT